MAVRWGLLHRTDYAVQYRSHSQGKVRKHHNLVVSLLMCACLDFEMCARVLSGSTVILLARARLVHFSSSFGKGDEVTGGR